MLSLHHCEKAPHHPITVTLIGRPGGPLLSLVLSCFRLGQLAISRVQIGVGATWATHPQGAPPWLVWGSASRIEHFEI